jgi:hypothetical protein
MAYSAFEYNIEAKAAFLLGHKDGYQKSANGKYFGRHAAESYRPDKSDR